MKLIILLSSVILIQAAVTKNRPDCDGVMFKGVYHDKETLITSARFNTLEIDLESNNVYASVLQENIPSEIAALAKINLITKEVSIVPHVSMGSSYAIDNETKDIFIGKRDGIYKYDSKNNSTSLYVPYTGIFKMQYHENKLLFSLLSDKLYVCKDMQCSLYKGLENSEVMHFVIDKDNTMYFTNMSGLYSVEGGTANAILLKRRGAICNDKNIALDALGQLYVSVNCYGVYMLNKKTLMFEKVLDSEIESQFTFDKDGHMIYLDWSNLYRLIPNENKNC